MEVRIAPEDIAREIDSALARALAGDEILIERNGRVVARLIPAVAPKDGLRGLLKERRRQPRWNDEDYDAFESDLAIARAALNARSSR